MYYTNEKTHINSHRDHEGPAVKTLMGAKMAASKRQMFQGTVVSVETESGETVAYKEPGCGWVEL